MKLKIPEVVAIAFFFSALSFHNFLHAAERGADDVYQIVKTTNDRVWRLNKKTGEIAVCTLEGENLVCTTSTEAVRPPGLTYEQREVQRQKSMAEEKERRQRQNKKDLEFLDKVLATVKELFGAAMERETEK